MIFSERDPVVWSAAQGFTSYPHPCPIRNERPLYHNRARNRQIFERGM